MKTAVVILNWNTKGFLEKFLPPLLGSIAHCDGAEVIVADNASTDGSLELMKEKFPEVKTIAFDRNYGFTGGYNKAFKHIEAEYFVLINSDIEVTAGWLEPLVEWMDTHPDCGACAPKLHSWQERDKFEYAGAAGGYIDRFGYPLCRGRVMSRLDSDRGQYDSPKDVFWATGACLMVRSKVYKELEGLDERFFAHMEEIDLCWRMQLAGWKVTVVPESTVYHVGGGTLPAASPFKLFLNYRNNLLMLNNNLHYTYALDAFTEGESAEDAAEKGLRKARKLIFVRKTLDILSSFVYLLTFRLECFKAVFKAHKEYKKLHLKKSQTDVKHYLENNAYKAEVKGRYGRSIIIQSLLKGEGIFENIESEVL
jgi:GT2 family glycosyltransferase